MYLDIYHQQRSSSYHECPECISGALQISCGWLGGVVVSMLDSGTPGQCKLLTPMCLCYQAVQFGTGHRAVMLCGREGNRRSGIALTMRHRL